MWIYILCSTTRKDVRESKVVRGLHSRVMLLYTAVGFWPATPGILQRAINYFPVIQPDWKNMTFSPSVLSNQHTVWINHQMPNDTHKLNIYSLFLWDEATWLRLKNWKKKKRILKKMNPVAGQEFPTIDWINWVQLIQRMLTFIIRQHALWKSRAPICNGNWFSLSLT